MQTTVQPYKRGPNARHCGLGHPSHPPGHPLQPQQPTYRQQKMHRKKRREKRHEADHEDGEAQGKQHHIARHHTQQPGREEVDVPVPRVGVVHGEAAVEAVVNDGLPGVSELLTYVQQVFAGRGGVAALLTVVKSRNSIQAFLTVGTVSTLLPVESRNSLLALFTVVTVSTAISVVIFAVMD